MNIRLLWYRNPADRSASFVCLYASIQVQSYNERKANLRFFVVLRGLFSTLVLAGTLIASDADLKRAESLYQHTDYTASLQVLKTVQAPDAQTFALMGRDYYMLGDYKKATDCFQNAISREPNDSDFVLWMGRTYGRRAETASPFLAPLNASKARQYFEKAVELDPKNREALNDLFDYYLQAPGFLGGGSAKAEEIAKRIGEVSPAEYHFAQAHTRRQKERIQYRGRTVTARHRQSAEAGRPRNRFGEISG